MPKEILAWRVWLSEAAERQCDRSLALAFGECVLDLIAETLEIGAAQLCALELRVGQRIDRLAIAQNLEVQMRAGRSAGVADEADQFALADARPFLNAWRKTREVPIDRREFPLVVDPD